MLRSAAFCMTDCADRCVLFVSCLVNNYTIDKTVIQSLYIILKNYAQMMKIQNRTTFLTY